MRIKLLFFRWFAELIQQIVKKNQKFIKKERKRQEIVSRQADD